MKTQVTARCDKMCCVYFFLNVYSDLYHDDFDYDLRLLNRKIVFVSIILLIIGTSIHCNTLNIRREFR